MENIVFCMAKVILPACGGLNSLMLIQLLILSRFPFLPQKCECAIGSQQMTFILTYPLLDFSPPVFPWWHCSGVEYHTIISVAWPRFSANNLDSPACF